MLDRSRQIELLSKRLPLQVIERGAGRPFLILHGGAGPNSVLKLAQAIGDRNGRAIVPTHPGFDGQVRPNWFCRITDLASAYVELLEQMDVEDVVVVGNSIGGWIAMEMGLKNSSRISSLVLLNAVGIDTGSKNLTIGNPMTVPPPERPAFVFHDPQKFALVPPTPEAAAMMAENQKTTMTYAGEPYMHDPGLRARLSELRIPALVAWGASDRIVTQEYGRFLAGSIKGSRFEIIQDAGHLPQIEKAAEVIALMQKWSTDTCPASRAVSGR